MWAIISAAVMGRSGSPSPSESTTSSVMFLNAKLNASSSYIWASEAILLNTVHWSANAFCSCSYLNFSRSSELISSKIFIRFSSLSIWPCNDIKAFILFMRSSTPSLAFSKRRFAIAPTVCDAIWPNPAPKRPLAPTPRKAICVAIFAICSEEAFISCFTWSSSSSGGMPVDWFR